jgi:hypothetical protein
MRHLLESIKITLYPIIHVFKLLLGLTSEEAILEEKIKLIITKSKKTKIESMRETLESEKEKDTSTTEHDKELRLIRINASLFEVEFSIKNLEKNKRYSPLAIVFDIIPFGNILISTLSNINNVKKNENKAYNTVIEAVIINRIAKDYKSYLFLIISIIALTLMSFLNYLDLFYIAIPIVLILLLHLNQRIIKTRIKKGWYGNNYYEAFEIIKYIDEHFDKNDFFNDDGMKSIFPKAEKDSKTYEHDGVLGRKV